MAAKLVKSPNSPKYPLSWAVDKMMLLLEKEGIHPVAPDIMAQHLGYTNSRNGQAASVLGTLRMYGLLVKADHRKDLINEEVKKFKFTPYSEEKTELVQKWLRTPKVFGSILEKYREGLPSDPALRYELIQDLNFSEDASNKLIKILRQSIEFATSFGSVEIVPEENTDTGHDNDIEAVKTDSLETQPKVAEESQNKMPPLIEHQDIKKGNHNTYKVHISGPGLDSVIEVFEEEDLLIVKAMLKKVEKKLASLAGNDE